MRIKKKKTCSTSVGKVCLYFARFSRCFLYRCCYSESEKIPVLRIYTFCFLHTFYSAQSWCLFQNMCTPFTRRWITLEDCEKDVAPFLEPRYQSLSQKHIRGKSLNELRTELVQLVLWKPALQRTLANHLVPWCRHPCVLIPFSVAPCGRHALRSD